MQDPSSNLEDNAGFQSVLSVDSSTSTFDFEFCIDEERPAKRAKVGISLASPGVRVAGGTQ